MKTPRQLVVIGLISSLFLIILTQRYSRKKGTQERQGAATVVDQEGTQVRVRHRGQQITARMVGFPPAFRLRPGEQVILVDDPSGFAARPLVRTISFPVRPDTLEQDRQIETAGRPLVMQDSTVVESEPMEPGRASEEETLWVVEPGEAEGPSQVIAVRRPRR